ncbi:hypothetical protein KIL84_002230 [Mauremys mutica]|uniref:Uncharacterized protein n=1 Tax=Mauremys mutica TaxID=74926 RepID=A0A9D3X6Z8_9SAUR|nr:hypothetical protein KIL84_002230 [Mauremys mutica]
MCRARLLRPQKDPYPRAYRLWVFGQESALKSDRIWTWLISLLVPCSLSLRFCVQVNFTAARGSSRPKGVNSHPCSPRVTGDKLQPVTCAGFPGGAEPLLGCRGRGVTCVWGVVSDLAGNGWRESGPAASLDFYFYFVGVYF